MPNRTHLHSGTIAALGLLGLGLLGLVYTGQTGSEPMHQSRESAPAVAFVPAPVASLPGVGYQAHDLVAAKPSGETSTAAERKRQQHERMRAGVMTTPGTLDLLGPRPAPAADLDDVRSDRELTLSAQLQAEQARRLGDALAGRVTATQERLDAARTAGDEAEAAREAIILARLQGRMERLDRSAQAFAAEAAEDELGDDDFAELVEDEHEHEHEHAP